jgi:hypothetical protein
MEKVAAAVRAMSITSSKLATIIPSTRYFTTRRISSPRSNKFPSSPSILYYFDRKKNIDYEIKIT